jgi:Domain of unknown function (DUF1816)
MQDTVLKLFNSTVLAWWVEVITESPSCTYYFGPFIKESSSQVALPGYVEDLEQEGAIGIRAISKRCKPEQLTMANDESSEPGWLPK